MLSPRIIPVLLISDGDLYKTINFKEPKYVGDPLNTVRILNEKEVDELILLDITSSQEKTPLDWELISHISRECRMPLCYGGGIRFFEDIERIISLGVEKVAIGKSAYYNPDVVKRAVKSFGSQSIVGVLDIKKFGFKRNYEAFVLRGTKRTKMNHIEYAKYLTNLGVGEILLQNIDLDGTMSGFDIKLIHEIYKNIEIPLTVLGGAGSLNDLRGLINKFKILGIAAGSIFIFKGKHKAVLINYPDQFQKELLIKGK